MDAVGILIGLMAFCMPHLSASAVGVSLAWAGLPYPAELLAVLSALLILGLTGIPVPVKKHLQTASLVASVALVAFECICAAVTRGAAGELVLSFVGEMLHALAVVLWLLFVSLGDEQYPLQARMPRVACALLGVSGAVWYIATALIRLSRPAWNPAIEAALWLSAMIWVLPILMALWMCNLAPRSFAFFAAMPFAGALAGNRVWYLFTLFVPIDDANGVPNVVLFVAPALAVAAFLLVWLACGTDNQVVCSTNPSGTNNLVICSTSCSTLPLHRLSGAEKLSDREREVLLLTLEGKNSFEVGEACGIAAPTVRTYLGRAYEKLDVAGAPELIAALRSTIEGTAEPVPVIDANASTFAAPIVIGVPTALIMLVSIVVGLVPKGGPRSIVGFALVLAALVVAIVRLRKADDIRIWAPAFAFLTGGSVALVTGAVALGPTTYLLRRAVLGLVLVAAALALTRRAKKLVPLTAPLTCSFAGLVGVCLIPQGIRVQVLIHGLAPLPIAAVMLLFAWILVYRATNEELAALASAELAGDERTLAYLNGRGLKDLVAQVALLTARNYPLGGIAATLSLSESTVTHYRKRAYDALGVGNKAELTDLLVREAGL